MLFKKRYYSLKLGHFVNVFFFNLKKETLPPKKLHLSSVMVRN